jgi:anti-anti-sigma factor
VLVVEQDDEASVILVAGALDPVATSRLAAAITGADSASAQRVIVSLEKCSRLGPAGLGVLARAKTRLGARFLVVIPRQKKLRKMLEATGPAKRLSFCNSVQEGLTMAIASDRAMQNA